ncbi:ABC transporter permease [Isoptericola sp. BMS4]|uniref:ABC transporter permease n=1 Tax=Isoptericola sp. BMS4 TaxID=2527875 RepID=UPI001422CA48|nr:ABC transporter permease [Isoptericola sp. BMS4]
MTTAVATRTATRRGGRQRGFGLLLRTETVVWLRDFGSVFFGILFPSVILLGVGFGIPGMREPITDAPADSPWYGVTPIATYLPTVLAMAVGTLAIMSLPVTFATFRDKGVLRRLSTTPMRPQAIIVAHLIINVVTTLVGVALALVVAQLAFGIVAPTQLAVLLGAFALGMLAMFSLGMLIAALVNKPSTANAVGSLVYFPLLFLAGLWTPGPIMPDIVRQVGQFTPLGAAAQAMNTGWFGDGVPLLQYVVMAAYTVVLLPLAIRLFRWT